MDGALGLPMCLTEQPFRSPPPLFDSTSSISRVSWAYCGQVTFGFWQAKCEKRSFPLLSSWPLRRSQDRQALSAKGYAQAKRLSPVVPPLLYLMAILSSVGIGPAEAVEPARPESVAQYRQLWPTQGSRCPGCFYRLYFMCIRYEMGGLCQDHRQPC